MEAQQNLVCDQPNCGQVKPTYGALRKHYHDAHPKRKDVMIKQHAAASDIICPYCDHGYNSKSKMFEHIRTKRAANDVRHQDREGIIDPLPQKKEVQEGKLKFHCPQCPAKFTQQSTLNRHLDKERCPNKHLAVPQFGIERHAPSLEQQQDAGANLLAGQQEEQQQDSSFKEIQEEEKKEGLPNLMANQAKDPLPLGSDTLMSSQDDHHQGDHHQISRLISSLPNGSEDPEAGQPLIGSSNQHITFINDQQVNQSSFNIEVFNDNLLNNNNNNNNNNAIPGTNDLVPANDSNIPPIGAEQIALLKSGGYSQVNVSPQCNYFGSDYYEEEEDNEWTNGPTGSRSEHEQMMGQVIMSDQYEVPVATFRVSKKQTSNKRWVQRKPKAFKKVIECNSLDVQQQLPQVEQVAMDVVPSLSLSLPVAQDEVMQLVDQPSSIGETLPMEINAEEVINIDAASKTNTPTQQIYSIITKHSALIWSQRDITSNEDVNVANSTRNQCKNQDGYEEREADRRLVEESNASVGYGEISQASMEKVINLLKGVINAKMIANLQQALLSIGSPTTLADYNLTEQSAFLDIGSGFGKVVWHVYVNTQCFSTGWEILPIRHWFAYDSSDLLLQHGVGEQFKELISTAQRDRKVQFVLVDAATGSAGLNGGVDESALPYTDDNSVHFSHILCFCIVFSETDLMNIMERINTTDFKILVWCLSESKTKKIGVKDVVYIGSVTGSYNGGTAPFYFYAKVPTVIQPQLVRSQEGIEQQCDDDINAPIQFEPLEEEEKEPYEVRLAREKAAYEEEQRRQSRHEEEEKKEKPVCPICKCSDFASTEELEAHASEHYRDEPGSQRKPDVEDELIQCDACPTMVPFSQYEAHGLIHKEVEDKRRAQQQQQINATEIIDNVRPGDDIYQDCLLGGHSSEERQRYIQRQNDIARQNPLPPSWKDKYDFNSLAEQGRMQLESSGQINPPRQPPVFSEGYPGKVTFTKFAGSSKYLYHGRSLQETLNRRYRFSGMTTVTPSIKQMENNGHRPVPLNLSDFRYLPVAVLTQEDHTALENATDTDKVCVICHIEFKVSDEIMVMRCGHYGHRHCLVDWLSRDYRCMMCRHIQTKRGKMDDLDEEEDDVSNSEGLKKIGNKEEKKKEEKKREPTPAEIQQELEAQAIEERLQQDLASSSASRPIQAKKRDSKAKGKGISQQNKKDGDADKDKNKRRKR